MKASYSVYNVHDNLLIRKAFSNGVGDRAHASPTC